MVDPSLEKNSGSSLAINFGRSPRERRAGSSVIGSLACSGREEEGKKDWQGRYLENVLWDGVCHSFGKIKNYMKNNFQSSHFREAVLR